VIRSRQPPETSAVPAACTITNATSTAMGKSFEFYENVKMKKRPCDFASWKATAILFLCCK
jgi:hypothetical protein